MHTLKLYYRLTKPGIVYGNAIAVIAGFLLASRTHINGLLMLETLVAVSFIIGSACVFNNYIDRSIDKVMQRTKRRATVTQVIPKNAILLYATLLGLVGFIFLLRFTNAVTVILGTIAYITYIVLYGIAKRRSVHGTLVGSIAGALPPAAGYTAVTGSFDMGAFLLFLIMTCWQMPHFYAIAIYRQKDYAAAHIPVLPIKKGIANAKRQIVLYIIGFALVASLLTVYHYTGLIYLGILLLVSAIWLKKAVYDEKRYDSIEIWARRMFFFSLIVLLVWCVMLSIDAWLI